MGIKNVHEFTPPFTKNNTQGSLSAVSSGPLPQSKRIPTLTQQSPQQSPLLLTAHKVERTTNSTQLGDDPKVGSSSPLNKLLQLSEPPDLVYPPQSPRDFFSSSSSSTITSPTFCSSPPVKIYPIPSNSSRSFLANPLPSRFPSANSSGSFLQSSQDTLSNQNRVKSDTEIESSCLWPPSTSHSGSKAKSSTPPKIKSAKYKRDSYKFFPNFSSPSVLSMPDDSFEEEDEEQRILLDQGGKNMPINTPQLCGMEQLLDWMAKLTIEQLQMMDSFNLLDSGKKQKKELYKTLAPKKKYIQSFRKEWFKEIKIRSNLFLDALLEVEKKHSKCNKSKEKALGELKTFCSKLVNSNSLDQWIQQVLIYKKLRSTTIVSTILRVKHLTALGILSEFSQVKNLYGTEFYEIIRRAVLFLPVRKLNWPTLPDEIQYAKDFVKSNGNPEQGVRCWTTLENPIFFQLIFEKSEKIYDFNTEPFRSSSKAFSSCQEFLEALIKKAWEFGYGNSQDSDPAILAQQLLKNIQVDYFSKLLRAGANGIFAPCIAMLRSFLVDEKKQWKLDCKSTNSKGETIGGTSKLRVCFLGPTEFITHYTRNIKLVKSVAGEEQPELLADLELTWTLTWRGENSPPQGHLKIKLCPSSELSSIDLCQLLYQWTRNPGRQILSPVIES